MEFVVFSGGALVVAIFLIWRSRRGTSRGLDTLTRGLPDDLREKNAGLISQPNRGRPWGRGN